MRTKKDIERTLANIGHHGGANPTAWGLLLALLNDFVDRLPDDEVPHTPWEVSAEGRDGQGWPTHMRVAHADGSPILASDVTRLHALLAAHPVPETDPEWCTFPGCTDSRVWHDHPAPVSDPRREDVAREMGYRLRTVAAYYRMCGKHDEQPDPEFIAREVRLGTDAVLAVLPAPPVEDGGWTVADWEEWANEVAATLPEDCDGDEAQVEIIAQFVRRAASPPVVDEAEIAEVVKTAINESYTLEGYLDPGVDHDIAAAVAAHLRGATPMTTPAPPVVDEMTLEEEARAEIIERLGTEIQCADGPRRVDAFVHGAQYAAARLRGADR